MKVSCVSLIYTGILLASTCSVIAQENGKVSEHIDTVVNAKPLERVAPKYPMSAARSGQEGWSRISFVIDTEGNVIDPVIMDSSGLTAFDKEALKAVKKWKYSPAIQDGEAIEQCQMSVQMDFKLHQQKGVTRQFKNRYEDITDAIAKQNLDEAAAMLTELGDSQLWNHSESVYYYLADGIYAKQIGDQQRELQSVNRALSAVTDTLNSSTQLYLLERQFVLSLTQHKYLDVLGSFKTLQSVKGSDELVTKFKPYAEQVSELLKSNDPLQVDATIKAKGQYYHTLSRESFTLTVEQGELDEVQVRCANKRSRFTFAENSQWKIPKAWGQCTIFVTGVPDTQFKVHELGAYVGDI